jgi:hypothetical protein
MAFSRMVNALVANCVGTGLPFSVSMTSVSLPSLERRENSTGRIGLPDFQSE